MGRQFTKTTTPRAEYENYEGTLTTNTMLDILTDLGRKSVGGSIENTHAADDFTFKLNSTGDKAITMSAGDIFNLDGQQVSAIYLIHDGVNSSYAIYVN